MGVVSYEPERGAERVQREVVAIENPDYSVEGMTKRTLIDICEEAGVKEEEGFVCELNNLIEDNNSEVEKLGEGEEGFGAAGFQGDWEYKSGYFSDEDNYLEVAEEKGGLSVASSDEDDVYTGLVERKLKGKRRLELRPKKQKNRRVF
ncbi:hypothetical protein PIB30_027500 [Stylosanthes scabra]|uniref:Uncharacterized protein n=1 Tax=Stylosanthes scabra TaxID=79078 RepID=A0ABU6RB72_9FABA|nr:hypothetical protein [Stylosanthes scabra]